MLLVIAACAVSGLVVSASTTALMRRLAPRLGLVDHPSSRKVHVAPTPLGGGLAIACGVILPLAAAEFILWLVARDAIPSELIPSDLSDHLPGIMYRSPLLWSIVLAGIVISALGLVDDLRSMSWQPKLAVQFVVAGGLVAGGVRGTLFVDIPWIGWGLTVLWIVVLTNAFNFLDNMDGLSAGIGLIASVIFAVIMLTGTAQPHWFVAVFLFLLAGSLAGFLFHNWPPAKIFMGDTGSCLIGLWLACMTVVGTFYDYGRGGFPGSTSAAGPSGTHVILVLLCVLAVPLYDFCSVLLIRLSQGRSPFHADTSHFSHRLVELGMSRKHAVLTIYLITLTTGLGGLLLYQVEGWPGALLVLLMVLCMLAVIAILETAARSAALKNSSSTVG
jgi:UDP-GlcNAc:undecaprenyl-phosphate GlcNAc-1-phosphate transferase